MVANESRWVLWDFKWMFVLAAATALLMVGAGIAKQGLISGMVFSGAFLLFAVLFSFGWSWRIHTDSADPELRQPVVIVGGVGIAGNGILLVATGDWSAGLNAAVIALLFGVLWWNLRDSPLWTASKEQESGQ